jgi:hypothetical protein
MFCIVLLIARNSTSASIFCLKRPSSSVSISQYFSSCKPIVLPDSSFGDLLLFIMASSSTILKSFNPPENQNQNQPTVNHLRWQPMVFTEIPETSHGFYRSTVGALPVPLDDSFLGPAESRKRKVAM